MFAVSPAAQADPLPIPLLCEDPTYSWICDPDPQVGLPGGAQIEEVRKVVAVFTIYDRPPLKDYRILQPPAAWIVWCDVRFAGIGGPVPMLATGNPSNCPQGTHAGTIVPLFEEGDEIGYTLDSTTPGYSVNIYEAECSLGVVAQVYGWGYEGRPTVPCFIPVIERNPWG